jgi:orotidine-5'-phosphate decarboxylase
MMEAAVKSGLTVFAVTVLTSLSPEQCRQIYGRDPSEVVPELALMAKAAGCHGVVCSPKEVGLLSSYSRLRGMEFVIPGVRSPGVSVDDQKRVDTPVATLRAGATRLVVGRQVTKATSPEDAFNSLVLEISQL